MFRWYGLFKLKLSLYCSTGSLPWLVQYLLRELFISRHWYSAFTPCCWCCCVVEANPLSAETRFPPNSILEGCLLGGWFVLLFFSPWRHYSCMILSFQCCTSVSFRPDIFYTHFSSRLDSKYLHARLIHSSKPHLHTPLDYTSITHTTAAHSPHTRITHATAALTPHSQHSSHTRITHATAALSLHSYSQLQNEVARLH